MLILNGNYAVQRLQYLYLYLKQRFGAQEP